MRKSYVSPYNQFYLKNPENYRVKKNPITNHNYLSKIQYESEYKKNFVDPNLYKKKYRYPKY